jgi:hypothetical protein
MKPMTPHEKECALAACALRQEQAEIRRDRKEAREWRELFREIVAAPLVQEDHPPLRDQER